MYKILSLLIYLTSTLLMQVTTVSATDPSSSKTITLSQQDKADLERYFTYALSQSQGGYVLYGSKPVCGEGIFNRFPLEKASLFQWSLWEVSEIIRRGLAVWEQLNVNKSHSPIQLVKCRASNNSSALWREVLWINKAACEGVIDKSLPLFQYILGPHVSAKEVTDALASSSHSIERTLKNNKVLIGIIFGFGVENSLTQSRIEQIEEAAWEQESVPLLTRHQRTRMPSPLVEQRQLALLSSDTYTLPSELSPSFGFTTLKEEYDHLQKQIVCSTTDRKYLHPPIPTFGYIPNSDESTQLLKAYERDQKKLQRLLRSPTLLEDTLELILGYRPIVIVTEDEGAKRSSARLDSTPPVSQVFLQSGDRYVREALGAFQENAGSSKETKQKLFFSLLALDNARAVNQAHRCLTTTERNLKDVAGSSGVHELIPEKIYYRTLRRGTGPRYAAPDQVQIRCSVWDLTTDTSNNCLLPDRAMSVATEDLIPGLRYALQDMRQSESREIYIHPDYAYGCHSNFKPAMGLRVEVTLLSVESSQNDAVVPEPFDDCRSRLLPKIDEREMQKLERTTARAEGQLLKQLSQEHKVLSDFFNGIDSKAAQ